MKVLKVAAVGLAVAVLSAAGALLFLIQRNLPSSSSSPKIPRLSAKVSVAFDDRGVATVTAATVRDALRVQGWLTARERLFQLELQRRLARGELAEIFGASLLPSDRAHRTLGFARVADAALPLLPAGEREDLASLADGINAFLDARPGRLGLEFAVLRISPKRFTPADALVVHLLMCEDLATSWRRDLALEKLAGTDPAVRRFVTETVSSEDVLLVPDAAPVPAPPRPALGGPPLPALGTVGLCEEVVRGSNAWAVSGTRAKGGRPLLANDPHLPLTLPGIWLPMRFVIAGRLVEGVTLPGLPGVILGRNDRIAWGMTTLRTDVQDLYRETIANGKAKRGSGWEDLPRGPKRSPSVAASPTRSVARHVPRPARRAGPGSAGPRSTRLSCAGDAVMTASDPESLFRALDAFPFPAHNVVWADAAGSIGWRATGLVPIRREGTDGSVPYDGSDPANDWKGYVPPSEMPRVVDPPEGFVVTANQRDIGTRFPHPVTTDWPSTERARRIADLLGAAAREGRRLDRPALEAIQLDTTSPVLKATLEAFAADPPSRGTRVSRPGRPRGAARRCTLAARPGELSERAFSAWGQPRRRLARMRPSSRAPATLGSVARDFGPRCAPRGEAPERLSRVSGRTRRVDVGRVEPPRRAYPWVPGGSGLALRPAFVPANQSRRHACAGPM